MKKVWIGLGIGCGSLILLGVIAVIAGGYWVSNKMEGAKQLTQKMQAQNKALQALDAKFPFTPPSDGQPLALEEARLKKYLAIRQALVPLSAKLEARATAIDKKTAKASLGEAVSAVGEMVKLQQDLRDSFIAELGRQEMSPGEFVATTDALYRKEAPPGEQRQSTQQEIASLEEKLKVDSLTAEDKQALEEELRGARQRLDQLAKAETGPAAEIRTRNARLIAQYQDEIDRQSNPRMDQMLGFVELDPLAGPGKRARVHHDLHIGN